MVINISLKLIDKCQYSVCKMQWKNSRVLLKKNKSPSVNIKGLLLCRLVDFRLLKNGVQRANL